MSNHPHYDMYYDQNPQRSPGSHRHASQTLHRQPSRQFDAYGAPPSSLYTAEDHAAQQQNYGGQRYNTDRMNAATMNSNYTQYDPWNSYNPQQNNTVGGAGSRMKPSLGGRGRPGLPTVNKHVK
jgi:hypothetical protein